MIFDAKRSLHRTIRRTGVSCFIMLAVCLAACDRHGTDAAYVGGRSSIGAISPAEVRASRRLYDGAPPVIPHARFSSPCSQCHATTGVAVQDLGFAPPSPHEGTEGLGARSRCAQCHVYASQAPDFVANDFIALRQDLRHGRRLNSYAPPVIPHSLFMRENCSACHSGIAAREEIRTSHPERTRCRQCHLERKSVSSFTR